MARFWRRNGGLVNWLVCIVGGSVSRPSADILGTARAADGHRRPDNVAEPWLGRDQVGMMVS